MTLLNHATCNNDEKVIEILNPLGDKCPILASIPHSGIYIPAYIKKLFNDHHIKTLRNTDWYLKDLFDFLPSLGVTVIQANFSRYVIDVNRQLNQPYLGDYRNSVVYQKNTWDEEIYNNMPDTSDIEIRVQNFYNPYHDAINNQIDSLLKRYSHIYFLDLHSFMGPLNADICLGNNNNPLQSQKSLPLLKKLFEDEKFDVRENEIFSGGHITQKYGQISNVEALQIELHYSLYLANEEIDKDKIPEKNSVKFLEAKSKLEQIFKKFTDILTD